MTSEDDSVIREIERMQRDVASGPEIYRPGEFWTDLLARNIEMIRDSGIANLKRTVSNNYYNWLVTKQKDPQFRSAFAWLLRHPTSRPFLNEMEAVSGLSTQRRDAVSMSGNAARRYRWFSGIAWEIAVAEDRAGLTGRLQEPEVGNPIRIRRQGRLISQDLANSIIEYNFVAAQAPAPPRRVAELGAGYGRLAFVHAEAAPVTYCIFDIPPALAISEWYLTAVLGADRIIPYGEEPDFESLSRPVERGRVAFFRPDQMERFPDRWFDLCQSISTLPEMPRRQSDHYVELLAAKSRGLLFLKQWRDWHNPADDAHYTEESYSLPAPWALSARRVDPVQTQFFNRLWERGAGGAGA